MKISLNERMSLSGKTAIVTGAVGFLGKHFCAGLAEAGANVVVVDLDQDGCEKFALELVKKYKIQSMGVSCDVTNPVSVSHMTEKACSKFLSIDILLNNAAYKSKNPDCLFAPFEDYSLDEWKQMIDVNINGVFLCSQAVGSVMIKQGHGGSIIQMSSIYGIRGTDHRIYEKSNRSGCRTNNPASYSTTKGAVIALTKYLATYWADKGIRVNAISPGGVKNNQREDFVHEYSTRVPMGRMAQPGEIVGALIFLASDASTYVTGQNIVVDGGLSVW